MVVGDSGAVVRANPRGWPPVSEFGTVDAMFAPVVLRFRTYGVSLSPAAQGYADAMIAHPAMQAWLDAALQETDIVPEDEAGEPV